MAGLARRIVLQRFTILLIHGRATGAARSIIGGTRLARIRLWSFQPVSVHFPLQSRDNGDIAVRRMRQTCMTGPSLRAQKAGFLVYPRHDKARVRGAEV